MKQNLQKRFGVALSVYEIKAMAVNGYNAIFVDYSNQPEIRSNSYLFKFANRWNLITLSCRTETFAQCKKEFEAVLKTLKFEK